MSEQTGATEREAFAERINVLIDQAMAMGRQSAAGDHIIRLFESVGYRIVPADAVVVTPEIAVTAAEACEATAENWYFSAKATAAGGDDHNTSRYLDKAAHYRAAAAALRGEG